MFQPDLLSAARCAGARRVLVVGWASLEHGEATVGDVLVLQVVAAQLESAGIRHDVAWSRVMCPEGGLVLADCLPEAYSHLIFACGPLAGEAVAELHQRFARLVRLAVDVTVIDPDDPVVQGFDRVIARDRPGAPARRDLSVLLWPPRPTDSSHRVPGNRGPAAPIGESNGALVGAFLTSGQGEYGSARRHSTVISGLEQWLGSLEAAVLPLETRLDPRDWRLASTPTQFFGVMARLDVVVTMRLHALVLAVSLGIPAIAVDPVAGGGKVSAQAQAWEWPGLVSSADLEDGRLNHLLSWCLSPAGRAAARRCAGLPPDTSQVEELVAALSPEADPRGTDRAALTDTLQAHRSIR